MAAQVSVQGVLYVAGSKRPFAIHASKLVKVLASKNDLEWTAWRLLVDLNVGVARCLAARVSDGDSDVANHVFGSRGAIVIHNDIGC